MSIVFSIISLTFVSEIIENTTGTLRSVKPNYRQLSCRPMDDW